MPEPIRELLHQAPHQELAFSQCHLLSPLCSPLVSCPILRPCHHVLAVYASNSRAVRASQSDDNNDENRAPIRSISKPIRPPIPGSTQLSRQTLLAHRFGRSRRSRDQHPSQFAQMILPRPLVPYPVTHLVASLSRRTIDSAKLFAPADWPIIKTVPQHSQPWRFKSRCTRRRPLATTAPVQDPNRARFKVDLQSPGNRPPPFAHLQQQAMTLCGKLTRTSNTVRQSCRSTSHPLPLQRSHTIAHRQGATRMQSLTDSRGLFLSQSDVCGVLILSTFSLRRRVPYRRPSVP
ncbi:hypothetical protein C8Q74DRAFT_1228011 [Fomes fomentarius]|nr:hypothetical protein C8Q74DRAFT_1228011 [Fomes fomentarius]